MICPNCGENNPDENIFCNKCGKKMLVAPNAGNKSDSVENTYGADSRESVFGQSGHGDQAGFGQDNAGFFDTSPNTFGQTDAGFGDGGGSFSKGSFGGQSGFGQTSGFGSQDSFFQNNSFGDHGGFDQGNGFEDNGGLFQNQGGSIPGGNNFNFPETGTFSPDYPDTGSRSGRGGIPKPVLIAICALTAILTISVIALILDYRGLIKIPVMHGLIHGQEGQISQEGNSEGVEEDAHKKDSDKDDPDKENQGQEDSGKKDSDKEDKDKNDTGNENHVSSKQEPTTLSLSVTDIEPPEMNNYHRISLKEIQAAPSEEGSSTSNMIGDNDEVWRTEVRNIQTDDGRKIKITFEKSKAVVVAIKAGNWTSPEAYNMDSRPTKLYLLLGDHTYPLSLSDRQVVHYIVFSNPVELSELSMNIDSISNDTTGYFAITNISVYGE